MYSIKADIALMIDGGKKIKAAPKSKLYTQKKKSAVATRVNNGIFFESGSYGCVRYPQIKCSGKLMSKTQINKSNQNNLMSKISEINFYSLNELEVGNYLNEKKSETTDELFDTWVYVIKSCSIQRKKLNKDFEYDQCPKIQKYNAKKNKKEDNEYMLLYTKFVESENYINYLNKDFGIYKIFKLYYYQLSCAQLCDEFNMNHQDMHLQNILVDKNENFYLIDFGLSMLRSKFYTDSSKETLDVEYLKKILVAYQPSWAKLPVDYHICAYFIYENKVLDESTLDHIIESNMKKNDVFLQFEPQMIIYKKKMFSHYHNLYVNKPNIHNCVKHILENYCPTWDVYQINFISLYLLKSYIENHSMILDYIRMCKNGIHYDSKTRGTAQKYKKISSKLFQDYHSTSEMIYDEELYYTLNAEQRHNISVQTAYSFL